MQTIILIITILNTLAILYIIFRSYVSVYVDLRKDTTFSNNTLVGYRLTLWKKTNYGSTGIYSLYIPIKNKRKVELSEEIERLLKPNNPNRRYTLGATFSWLKTIEQVLQFQKDYSVVDEAYVNELVDKFKLKHNIKD